MTDAKRIMALEVDGETITADHSITLIAGEHIYAPCFVYIGKDGKAYMTPPAEEPM